ncbi:MAG: hypothetical protein LBR79_03455 [Oscillospiraceae bacterium]|jgi:hypothetical protein|nr:hypothetical protein [Oscillospiraceae bacterium]
MKVRRFVAKMFSLILVAVCCCSVKVFANNEILQRLGYVGKAEELPGGKLKISLSKKMGCMAKGGSGPIEALKERCGPISAVIYDDIEYMVTDKNTISITGMGDGESRINVSMLRLLYVFGDLTTTSKNAYDPALMRERKYTWYIPRERADEITTIRISGNIKNLDYADSFSDADCCSDVHRRCGYPFCNESLISRDPELGEGLELRCIPYRFVNLQTIDLTDCHLLQKMNWKCFRSLPLQTLILPNHPITCFDDRALSIDKKVKVINEVFVQQGEEGLDCCLLL